MDVCDSVLGQKIDEVRKSGWVKVNSAVAKVYKFSWACKCWRWWGLHLRCAPCTRIFENDSVVMC